MLAVGIILATFFWNNVFWWAVIFATVLAIQIALTYFDGGSRYFVHFIRLKSVLLLISFTLLGGLISSNYNQSNTPFHFRNHQSKHLIAEVVEIPDLKKNSIGVKARVNFVKDSLDWKKSMGHILIYFEKDSTVLDLRIGDQVIFANNIAEVRPPSNPGEFDYRQYLSFQYVYDQIYLPKDSYALIKRDKFSLFNVAHDIREHLTSILKKYGLKDYNLAVASALLLGNKSMLEPQLQQAYASAGAMHVLAVSGLHVGIIYLIINSLLGFILPGRKLKKIRLVIIIFCLWFYALITGLSPSVTRAATMFTAIAIGNMMNRSQNIYNTLASSAFVLLLFKPNFLFEVGFQLSYLAVLGIVFLYPYIYNWWYTPNKMLDRIWSLTSVSIAAQLATFPLGVLYFHMFPTYFMMSNLIVIPAALIIMYLGFALLVSSFINDTFTQWLATELIGIIDALNAFVQWVETLPNSMIRNIYFSDLDSILIYFIIISFIWVVIKRHSISFNLLMLFILALIISRTYSYVEYRNYNYLAIYNVKKSAAINLIRDRYNYTIDQGQLDIDLDMNPFQMKNNWIKHGTGDTELKSITNIEQEQIKMLSDQIVGVSGKTIGFINEKSDYAYEGQVNLDYLVLTKHKGLRINEVLEVYQPGVLIFDSTFSPYFIKKIRKYIPQDLNTYFVAIEGGIEYRLGR